MLPRSPAHRAIGQVIRELRLERNLAQEALAHESGLDRSYMGRVERGEFNITIQSLVQIADALGVRASTILRRAEDLRLNPVPTQTQLVLTLGEDDGD